MVMPSLWPMIGSGCACEPILANEMEEEGCWETLGKGFLVSKKVPWEEMPPTTTPHQLPVLKINMSDCDAWICGSHSGAMRRAHA